MDLYKFTVGAAATYTVETEGPTDVVMRLFGPNNRTSLIAEDDDSGADSNPRLVRQLAPGDYFVQIRHFSPQAASGKYDLLVLGTHGRTGFAHALMGSVAEKVVRRAPCPVLTVRATE